MIVYVRSMAELPDVPDVIGFQWDDGNADKNWKRHRVTQAEAEQVFFNKPNSSDERPGALTH